MRKKKSRTIEIPSNIMSVIFAYSLSVSLILAFLSPVLQFTVLRNHNFRFNRVLLLLGLMLSLAVPPLLSTDLVSSSSNASFANNIQLGETSLLVLESTPADTNSPLPIMPIIMSIYYTGILFLFFKTLYSLFIIKRLKQDSKKEKFKGINLYIHRKGISPFSLGNSIFISANDKNDLILNHERGHIKSKHWLDLILTEINCIFMWYNPMAWFYKRAVKLNHEYEADNAAISSGENADDYKHMLISKALEKKELFFANCFASKSIGFRKRIQAIGADKPSKAKNLTAALILPALAISIISIDNPVSDKILNRIENFEFVPKHTPTLPIAKTNSQDVNETEKNQDVSVTPEDEFDTKAYFPDGEAEMMMYVSRNLKYPEGVTTKGTFKVIVKFIVLPDGALADFAIENTSTVKEFDKAALEAVKRLPKFEPAIKDGKKVASGYSIPIRFQS